MVVTCTSELELNKGNSAKTVKEWFALLPDAARISTLDGDKLVAVWRETRETPEEWMEGKDEGNASQGNPA